MEWTRQIDRAAGRWTERSGRSGMGWSATTGTHWLRGDAAMRRDAWDAHFRPGAHQQSPGGRGGGDPSQDARMSRPPFSTAAVSAGASEEPVLKRDEERGRDED